MIGKRLEDSRFVPLFEVKELLKEREEGGELTYEQTLTKDYVQRFSKLTKANGRKFVEELSALVDDPQVAVKIADILPDSVEKLRLIFPKGAKVEDAKLEGIVKLIKKYLK